MKSVQIGDIKEGDQFIDPYDLQCKKAKAIQRSPGTHLVSIKDAHSKVRKNYAPQSIVQVLEPSDPGFEK